MIKIAIISGSFFALMSVIMGAFGAHLLKDSLNEYSKAIYDKAVLYQMFHSLAILISTLIGETIQNIDVSLSIWFFVIGIVLFSGSLYILAVTDIKWLGMITPIGGMFFIFGWAVLLYKSFNRSCPYFMIGAYDAAKTSLVKGFMS